MVKLGATGIIWRVTEDADRFPEHRRIQVLSEYRQWSMVVGWLQLGSDWYYMNGSGAMLTGWQKIGSTWYYLNPTTGKMATGWTIVGGSKYYMNGSGAMLTDWQNIDGSEYYFTAVEPWR